MKQLNSRRTRLLVGILAALLPVFAFHLWGAIETKRLRREVAAFRDSRSTVVAAHRGIALDGGATRAIPVRYYKAAADLTALPVGFVHMLGANAEAATSEYSVQQVTESSRSRFDDVVSGNGHAMQVLAAANSGDVMRPVGDRFMITDNDVRLEGHDIEKLWSLTMAHFMSYAAREEWSAAADATVQGAGLLRLFELQGRAGNDVIKKYWALWRSAWQVQALLEHGRLHRDELGRIESALAPTVRDDDFWRQRVAWRQRYIESSVMMILGSGVGSLPMRARWARAATETLRVERQLEEASSKAWPERLDRTLTLAEDDTGEGKYIREAAGRHVIVFAEGTALQRAALAAIGVERYRQATGALPATLQDLVPGYVREVPIDPFTGTAMHYRVGDAGFVIYSAGQNRLDEGGALRSLSSRFVVKKQQAGDLGLRVRIVS